MNLGDLIRIATMSGMEVKEDGGIEGDGASAFLFIQNLENYRREQKETNRSFGKIFDEDDML